MLDTHTALAAADGGLYDLPRTLLREREKQEWEARKQAHAQTSVGQACPERPVQAMVTRLQLPFLRLVFFFIKAAFAAIPALIILGTILWVTGHLLQLYFPELVKMQILIQFPEPHSGAHR